MQELLDTTLVVHKTYDYDQFKHLIGNRGVIPSHAKSIGKSIKRKNLLDYVPSIVNEKNEIIDGQHRLEGARATGKPFTYIVVPGLTVEDVQLLNAYTRKWNGRDYIESYSSQGNQNYILLKEFLEKYSVVCTMYTAIRLLTKRYRLDDDFDLTFRNGGFKVADGGVAYAERIAKYLVELGGYSEEKVTRQGAFVSALLRMLSKGITYETLIGKMLRNNLKIVREATEKQYLRQLEDILNHKNKVSQPIRLF